MTWSLLVHDPASGAFAVAVTTCALAVGASVPFLRRGVGAVATQSMTNRYLGPAALDAMARGLGPAAAIESALAGDEGRGLRQIHAIDSHGRAAQHTGANCVEWCGALDGEGWSLAGNMLAGPETLAVTRDSFLAHGELPLPERMLRALRDGEAAGGDRRGRQSAAIQLVTTEDFPDLDLRVDDHPAPLDELTRLLQLWRRDREPLLARMPRRDAPSGRLDMAAMEREWSARGLGLRFRR